LGTLRHGIIFKYYRNSIILQKMKFKCCFAKNHHTKKGGGIHFFSTQPTESKIVKFAAIH